ncbi:MAG: M17 family peptidase N-terminal domain-containing protein, partial [Verrucomicrobiota bacterium]|nr:M17 family peptidase N-terminal domain-containing protein [Verrucomicrobiota bacterium]
MNINIKTEAIAELQADVLAWPITSELQFADELKRVQGDQLSELVQTGETKGKVAELTILHSPPTESIRRHYLVGVGDVLDANSIFKAAGQAVRAAVKRGAKRLAIHL